MFDITLKREGRIKAQHYSIYAAKNVDEKPIKKDVGTEILISKDDYNRFLQDSLNQYLEEKDSTFYYSEYDNLEQAINEIRIYVENQEEYDFVHDLAQELLYEGYDDSYIDDMDENQKEELIETYSEKISDFLNTFFSYMDDIFEVAEGENYPYIVIEEE